MSRLTRDGTAEPASLGQILRPVRGQGDIHFPCSANHEKDWQPYPVDPYSAICDDHTYIHTYNTIYLKSNGFFKSLEPRDGTAEPVSRDQILRRERGQGNIHFPCSSHHRQDWQLYQVDPYSC